MKSPILFVVLGHGTPEEVAPVLYRWKQAAGGNPLLFVHGGDKEHFQALKFSDKTWVDDPRLRTKLHPIEKQSYIAVWKAVADWLGSRSADAIYLAEFDEFPVVPDLDVRLMALLTKENADVLGRSVRRVDASNDPHWLYHEFDVRYREPFEKTSRRKNKNMILSMLGTGSFWKREAFLEVAATSEKSPCYLELFLPTMAHHLGFRVRDFGEQSRFIGFEAKGNDRLRSEIEAGAWTVHPVKGLDQWQMMESLAKF